jgi:hypothetical protein
MSLRRIFGLLVALIILSALWGKRYSMANHFAPANALPKQIQFDNGSVRDNRPELAKSSISTQSQFSQGTLRKCIKDAQITYTDVACPPGYRERAVAGPPVNVMPAHSGQNSNEFASPSKGRTSLHDVLDLSRDEKLRDRMLEQAIEGMK